MGIITSLAILSSQLNTVLILPALYAIMVTSSKSRKRWKNAAAYLVTVVIIYSGLWAFLTFGLKGIRTYAEFTDWQRSYILSPRYWAGGLQDSLARTWHGATEVHLAYLWQQGSLFGKWNGKPGSILLMLGQGLVLLFLIIEGLRGVISWIINRPRPAIHNIAILAGLPIFLFSFIFTPEWFNYRILYLPAFMVFIIPVIERDFRLTQPSLRRVWLLLLVIISLFLVNFTVKFLPENNPGNNPYLVEAKELATHYGPHDRIIYLSTMDGDYQIKYARYFTQCSVTRVIDLVTAIRRNPDEVEAFFKDGIEDGAGRSWFTRTRNFR